MKRVILVVLALLPGSVFSSTTAIVGGTVAIGDGSQPIAAGTVVFRDGRVVAAGADVTVPAGATVVDAHGKWVAAGLVSGFTQLGIGSHSMLPEIADFSAPGSAFSAAIDVSTAINPLDAPIEIARAAGITRAVVSPAASSTIFGGQGAVIDLGSDFGTVMRQRVFQYLELGNAGGRLAGGSRPAAYAYFREAMSEAGESNSSSCANTDNKRRILTCADAAALAPLLQGKQILLIHVDRASDILEALELKRDYPRLRIVLLGVAEGWMVAPQITAAQVPVLSVGIKDIPSSYDQLAATESNVGRMVKAGVVVGITTIDHMYLETYLTRLAANLVALSKVPGATGLDWGQAFASITSKPAEAMGLADEIGSLRPGRRADVVIWDGDPLEATSAAIAVYIDGVPQSLVNHLTLLRDRYRDLQSSQLPRAYVH